jgi:two-component system CheB/CheR fusion protein
VLEIAEYLRGTIDHARELARGLSPVIAEGGNLLLALSSLADRTRKIFRCECEFRCDPPIALENAVVSSQLYRIVQEAVSNALHHGRARRVEIELSGANGELLLQILDNGIGLRQKPKKNPGMGLRIMSHRAEMIGASLAVQPRKNGGTEVICVLSRDNHKPILTGKTK